MESAPITQPWTRLEFGEDLRIVGSGFFWGGGEGEAGLFYALPNREKFIDPPPIHVIRPEPPVNVPEHPGAVEVLMSRVEGGFAPPGAWLINTPALPDGHQLIPIATRGQRTRQVIQGDPEVLSILHESPGSRIVIHSQGCLSLGNVLSARSFTSTPTESANFLNS